MPNLFLIPEIISQKIRVYLNTDQPELASEIRFQLSSHNHVEFVKSVHDADVTIYLAGFDPPSLSETLSHTTLLYEDLKTIQSDHHKFILVVKNPSSHLSRTAITLTNQYAHNYHLNHEVFEYDQSVSVPQLAQSIIAKFVHSHLAPAHVPSVHIPKTSPFVPPPISVVKKTNKPIARFAFYIILIVIFPWLISALLLGGMILSTNCLDTSPLCRNLASYANLAFRYTSRLSPKASEFSTHLGLPANEFSEILYTLNQLSMVSSSLDLKSAKYLSSIFSTSPLPQSADLLANLDEVASRLNELQANLRSLYLSTSVHNKSFEILAGAAGEARHSLATHVPQLSSFLEDFSIGKKTYLIVLQDNWEERASGGLAEAFLRVNLENGHVNDFQAYSTRDTDKLLKGNISAPSDYQNLTHQTQWFMRDVGWDANTKNTLDKVTWFAQKEIDTPIDNVILLDLNTLKSLIQIIGSVSVGESKLTVNSQNFSSVYESQLGNSQANPHYLSDLLGATFFQMSNLDSEKYQRIVKLFASQIESRQVFITSLAEGEQLLPECRSFLSCVTDYVYPISTNMTGTKTNFYLKKSQLSEITLTTTNITTHHQFIYSYTPSQNSWVSSNHQEYLRLYVPSSINSDYEVKIDGVVVPEESLHIGVGQGLKYLGVSFTVPKGKKITIDFMYHQDLPLVSQFHYQLDIPNQPGIIGEESQVSLSYPPTWAALVDKSASVADAGHLEYNYAQPEKFTLNIDFTKP